MTLNISPETLILKVGDSLVSHYTVGEVKECEA